MSFGGKKQSDDLISARRLAAVAGVSPRVSEQAPAAASAPTVSLEPDLKRIRPRMVDLSPEARKKRLAAKTVNFTFTIIARIIILAGLGYFTWNQYQFGGQLPRGLGVVFCAILADFGRVILKALEPGTK